MFVLDETIDFGGEKYLCEKKCSVWYSSISFESIKLQRLEEKDVDGLGGRW